MGRDLAGEGRLLRIAVVSDIHSNLVAFEAVLQAMGEVDQVWSLGDAVGYGPRPNEVIARLAATKHLAVAGNHDQAAVGIIDVKAFNPVAAYAAQWTTEQLTDETRAYITGLPTLLAAGEFTLVHGSPRAPIWEYITNAGIAAPNFAEFDGPFCLVGHTHVPALFARSPGGEVHARQIAGDADVSLAQPGWKFILNPGSVGQPRDDDPRAAFLLIDTETGSAYWRRVEYNIAATQQQMRDAKLPNRLVERLTHGW
jgi:diadenosine tetraphosphatase ApaH/serine/threonine PP2A family protein phosphatase